MICPVEILLYIWIAAFAYANLTNTKTLDGHSMLPISGVCGKLAFELHTSYQVSDQISQLRVLYNAWELSQLQSYLLCVTLRDSQYGNGSILALAYVK